MIEKIFRAFGQMTRGHMAVSTETTYTHSSNVLDTITIFGIWDAENTEEPLIARTITWH